MSDQPHARRSDPISSHLTVQSLGKDSSLKAQLITAALHLEDVLDRRTMTQIWTDTQLTETLEMMTGRRHQRNVVARTRGLLERDGWFERVGMFDFDGRPQVHFTTTKAAHNAR